MTSPYTQPYGPLASLQGIDLAGTLSGALTQQRGVDGQLFYATDIRQLLAWDNTTFDAWTQVHGGTVYQAYAAGPPIASRYLFDDFRGGTLDTRYTVGNGGGAAAASPVLVAGDAIGEVTLVTGTANGATACSGLTLDLGWTPNQIQPWQSVGAPASAGAGTFKQKLLVQGKAKISSITSSSFFLGLADILASTTCQTPLTLTATTLAVVGSTSNAVGFLFDTGATAKHVWCVAANAGTVAATPVDASTLGPAIAANTYLFYKLMVDTAGNATFYMAPVPTSGSPVWVQVGTISLAVAAAAALTPIAAVTSRSATSVTLTLDAWQAS